MNREWRGGAVLHKFHEPSEWKNTQFSLSPSWKAICAYGTARRAWKVFRFQKVKKGTRDRFRQVHDAQSKWASGQSLWTDSCPLQIILNKKRKRNLWKNPSHRVCFKTINLQDMIKILQNYSIFFKCPPQASDTFGLVEISRKSSGLY